MARTRRPRSAERLAEADSVVVIGLGRFGSAVALELESLGTEVLGIDGDEDIVQQLAGRLTHVVRADATDEEALRQLAVPEFDRAVVGIGTNIEASLLTASLLVGFEIDTIWAKAISAAHGRILEQLEVHHVVYPEHEMGRRVAHLARGRMLDFVEFEDDFAMATTTAPRELLDRALAETQLRARHGVTVVAFKRGAEDFTYATAETVLQEGDTVIAAGRTRAVERFSALR